MKKKVLAIMIVLVLGIGVFTGCNNQEPNPDDHNGADIEEEIVLENDAFRIYEPAPNTEITDNKIVVRGQARVFEATIQYEFEDGHNILDEGFTTASEGAPGWGDFEITIEFDEVANNTGTIILFEESAKDGSRLHEIMIPVIVKK